MPKSAIAAARADLGNDEPTHGGGRADADDAAAVDAGDILQRRRLDEKQAGGIIHRSIGGQGMVFKCEIGGEIGDGIVRVIVGNLQSGEKTDALNGQLLGNDNGYLGAKTLSAAAGPSERQRATGHRPTIRAARSSFTWPPPVS